VDFIKKRLKLGLMVSFVQLLMQKEIRVVADWRITLTDLLLVRCSNNFLSSHHFLFLKRRAKCETTTTT
jgi:hypothetical protein